MTEETRETFDRLSDHYANTVDAASPYNADYERPAMMAMLPENLSGVSVFDAGCAAGWYTEQLLRRGATVTAADISPEMTAAVKRRVGELADVQCLDLSQPLPFKNSSFHVVLSSLTLHYLKDWGPVFAEFARVLKPGGRLIFSTHHPFMDFGMSETQEYFTKEQLTDTWKLRGEPVQVKFYRRPLAEILNETASRFRLLQMVEPQPTEAFREKHPEGYERLRKSPHFLLIQAQKEK